MGHPFVGDPETAMFYPINFLYTLFKSDLVFGYVFVLDVFLIGVFTYFFVKCLGVSRVSSLVSAITFMFCGTVITHVYAGHMGNLDIMMLMTLAFLLLEKTIQKRSFFYGILFGVSLGLQFIAGNPQVSVYSAFSLFLYFLARSFFIAKNKKDFKEFLRLALPLVLSLIVAFSLAAVQILPTLELLGNSFRENRVTYKLATSYSLPPQQLVALLMPEFFGTPLDYSYWGVRNFWELSIYIGIFPLILAITAFIVKFRANNYKIIFAALAIFSLLFAFGKYFFVFPIFYYFVPFFNVFIKPSAILFLAAFSLSVLAGFGLDAITEKLEQVDKKRLTYLAKLSSVLIVFSILVWLFVFFEKDL
jgi:uncharacterized membrane protein YfhO